MKKRQLRPVWQKTFDFLTTFAASVLFVGVPLLIIFVTGG